MALFGWAGRAKRSAVATLLGVTLLSGLAIATNVGSAHALQIGDTVGKGWWNVNNVNGTGCGGTFNAPDHGGNRAVNSLSKFEVLTQVGQKKVHIHINTNAWYDPGAAEASYLYQKLYGRFPTCNEIAGYVGQDPYHVFVNMACNTMTVNSTWRTKLASFCSMPDSVLFDGNRVSAFFQPTIGSVRAQAPYGATTCLMPDGARSRERFSWPKLNVKVGSQKTILGTFKVWIDAVTVDAGPTQQRVLDPDAVTNYTSGMLQVALVTAAKYGANWTYTTRGRTGATVFDLKRYAAGGLVHDQGRPVVHHQRRHEDGAAVHHGQGPRVLLREPRRQDCVRPERPGDALRRSTVRCATCSTTSPVRRTRPTFFAGRRRRRCAPTCST